MATRQGYVGQTITTSNTVSCGLTLPADEFPVRITSFSGTLQGGNNTNSPITVTLCEGNGNNKYTMATLYGQSVTILGTNSPTNTAPMVDAVNLKGKALYIQVRGQANVSTNVTNGYAITIQTSKVTHPTVTAGTIITKAQMDNLKSYLGKGTAVTQYATTTATVGNTYASGLTAGTTAMNASWFNNA